MYDWLAPVSIRMLQLVLSANFPTVYPCPEIGKLSSALITLCLV